MVNTVRNWSEPSQPRTVFKSISMGKFWGSNSSFGTPNFFLKFYLGPRQNSEFLDLLFFDNPHPCLPDHCYETGCTLDLASE